MDNSFGAYGLEVNVGAILNNEETAYWSRTIVSSGSGHNFYWDNCPFKQGSNEVIWYIDGKEVARQTFTIIGDPNE